MLVHRPAFWIHSEKGMRLGPEFTAFIKSFDADHKHIAVYHRQTDGRCERFNGQLREILFSHLLKFRSYLGKHICLFLSWCIWRLKQVTNIPLVLISNHPAKQTATWTSSSGLKFESWIFNQCIWRVPITISFTLLSGWCPTQSSKYKHIVKDTYIGESFPEWGLEQIQFEVRRLSPAWTSSPRHQLSEAPQSKVRELRKVSKALLRVFEKGDYVLRPKQRKHKL